MNKHTLDTTQPQLMKKIMETSKSVDPYMKIEMASCDFETAENHWKPGGAMVGVSGKWASRICGRGSDTFGRWSWVDLRGKNFKIIRVISAYRVSQEVSSAGILTACQQQFRALVKKNHGITSPKEAFLADLEHDLSLWTKTDDHEVILMTDANETVAEGKSFASFIDSSLITGVCGASGCKKLQQTREI